MTLPGFTAEVALGTTFTPFRARASRRQASNLVAPASCDSDCLEKCNFSGDCDLLGLPPGACSRYRRWLRQQCQQACCN
jgi:hypothetical protein